MTSLTDSYPPTLKGSSSPFRVGRPRQEGLQFELNLIANQYDGDTEETLKTAYRQLGRYGFDMRASSLRLDMTLR